MLYFYTLCLGVACFFDIKTRTIPFIISLWIPAIPQLIILWGQECFFENITIAVVMFLIFFINMLFFSDIGGADAIISSIICLYLGIEGCFVVILGFLLSVPFAIKKTKSANYNYPFVPFLFIAYIIYVICYFSS